MTHLNLTRSLADVWGLTPEQVAAERMKHPGAALHIPHRPTSPEPVTIEVEPVRKPFAGKEARHA